MKIGNQNSSVISSFLDKFSDFAQQYANVAQSLITSEIPQSLVTSEIPQNESSGYNDFLDKFAINRAEQRSNQGIRERYFKFINTESNRDNRECELILRKGKAATDKIKIKLTHYTGSIDYNAFQSIWIFAKSEEKLAHQVFDTLEFTLEGIQTQFNSSPKHGVSLVPIMREAVKTIAESHRLKKNILFLDENDLLPGESNWHHSIYGNKYPSSEDPYEQVLLEDNHPEYEIKRSAYFVRNKKTTL